MNTEVREAVQRHIAQYVSKGVTASLLRNNHMNQYHADPETFDEGVVPELLSKLLKVSSFRAGNALSMLMALKAGAHLIRLFSDSSLKQTTIDAILVDFINYCGMQCGIDFALYTLDLSASTR